MGIRLDNSHLNKTCSTHFVKPWSKPIKNRQMKKFQILGTVLALSVVTILLVACQKEQDGVTNEVNSSKPEESLVAIEVNAANIPGIISQNEAAKMAANYKSQSINKSEYVAFNVKDIQDYLNLLKKQNSSKIYVNFGLYDDGRLTVFFSGDGRRRSGSIRGDNTDKETDFMNRGELFP